MFNIFIERSEINNKLTGRARYRVVDCNALDIMTLPQPLIGKVSSKRFRMISYWPHKLGCYVNPRTLMAKNLIKNNAIVKLFKEAHARLHKTTYPDW